ncbi:MAG: FMN-binding protein, partial [Acidobacteriaceae bacterium]|nr:FMN-binding protein [Acidobacteriaceae bacterium]
MSLWLSCVWRDRRWLRRAMSLALVLFAATAALRAEKRIAGFIEVMPTPKLQQLFPAGSSFLPRGEKDPIYFTALSGRPVAPIGYAFWTIDLVPGELGYHGHIHMLIGMDTHGRLTGVIVDVNTEPYGDISIERPEFAAQFKGKSIRDGFIVGEDLDAVSRATISVRAA